MNPLLLVAALAGGSAIAVEPPTKGLRFPALSQAETWKLLPRENPKLPVWACTLAESLPRTTAAMLELDAVHRVRSPLGPITSGKLRWWTADALGCDYLKAYAAADLRRAGLADEDLAALGGEASELSRTDRLLRAFARKMSRTASTVTDAEMAELLQRFGPQRVVGFVHTLAYANFQNRVILALGVAVEPGGPLPPTDVTFDRAAMVEAPARQDGSETAASHVAVADDRPDWLGGNVSDLQKSLASQKARKPRVPFPSPEILAKLPPEAKARTSKIAWTRISMGYQPALTRAWFDTMNTFEEEARFNQVFANTYFWVVTRTNDCFY